ncbi:sterol carrier family protein [Streptacidiphilus sp. P02-A3a]|uniref:sterol carrier family protein n=1 Tax=Streptacidiphilus sp. P02-A3a TaxID=2704468 RepID=UPI0015FD25BF|nr:sterol carrier family protein [Streptacidiphilus sp. P02-A3a]QMU73293.1 maleylpyruvate isomerase family mycothiol-dependent enzyme [Streptacidiphilus sp. P02-A3a]
MPPAARRVRVRSYDPATSRAALAAQAGAVRTLVHALGDRADAEALLAAPTRLGDWTVRDLVAHLGSAFDAITDNLGLSTGDAAPLTLTDWVAATRTAAPAIADRARQRGAREYGGGPAEVAAALDAAVERALALLADEYPPQLRLPTRFGAMLLTDYLVTRLVETVVHADDLAAALAGADPGRCPPADAFPHDRRALAAVVRLLADALAVQAPGGAVELRIPPFAVVQCVAGPRHTRGTPPNVVETAPLPWIRLATGRTSWARITGAEGNVAQLTAGGERSDLSALLPVMG